VSPSAPPRRAARTATGRRVHTPLPPQGAPVRS
jgi:hypothetical protein